MHRSFSQQNFYNGVPNSMGNPVFSEFSQGEYADQRVSFRAKGRQTSGKLVKGCTSQAFINKEMGSVPGKHETIVYSLSQNKLKGFGSNSERFLGSALKSPEKAAVPGPGEYLSKQNLDQMSK